MKHRGNFRH